MTNPYGYMSAISAMTGMSEKDVGEFISAVKEGQENNIFLEAIIVGVVGAPFPGNYYNVTPKEPGKHNQYADDILRVDGIVGGCKVYVTIINAYSKNRKTIIEMNDFTWFNANHMKDFYNK